MTKNFCGKNGCYDIFEYEEEDIPVLGIYLNSPVVQEDDDVRSDKRTLPENRDVADIDIHFTPPPDDCCEEGPEDPHIIEIRHFQDPGVRRFVWELLDPGNDLATKEGTLRTVERLLNQDGAVWGKVIPLEEAKASYHYLS